VNRLRRRAITRELAAPHATRGAAKPVCGISNAVVTVVVPSFNRASTIEAALRSIQRQTCALWEAVVVDDGSRDNGADRVARFAGEDPRIRLIRHGYNRGAQAARNTGIDAARTKWIAFLDSDDEWMPESLELRLDAAERDRLQVVHTGAYVIRENGDKSLHEVPAIQGWIHTQLLRRPGPMFQGLLVAKEAFTKIGGLDERIVALQEWDTAIRLAKHYRFGFVAAPTFVWNCRGSDTITKDRSRDAKGYEQVVRKHFFSMLRTGPETLSTHYRTLARLYAAARRKPDALRSRLYAKFWQLAGAEEGVVSLLNRSSNNSEGG
jgi:glycosyltransferase involved in cell wall biosynthesis